jgi:hypothetical protein
MIAGKFDGLPPAPAANRPASPGFGGVAADQPGADGDRLGAAQSSPVGHLVAYLQAESARIIANWVLRVANLPAFRAVPELALAELQDGVPDLVAAALDALLTPDPDVDLEPLARVTELARRHGRTRATEGFPIGVTLAGFQALRAEIGAAMARAADAEPALADARRELRDRLDHTLDSALIHAAEAWVAARLPAHHS